MYPHLGGFESTHIFGRGQDILGTTRHIEFWQEDLNLLLQAGITSLRYSIPWHRIEAWAGEFDWSWIDGPMQFMKSAGMQPIVDPLHHTSFPTWLQDGFLHPEFPALYERFLNAVSDRYGWVTKYTIINEPLPTTLFCSYTGMWYPHRRSYHDFVSMTMQVAKAICMCGRMLKRKNDQIELVDVGTAEHHRATDTETRLWVEHANARRFLMVDLVLGRVDCDHPLYAYLVQHGATEDDLRWFRDHPTEIDTLGLDYYIHSEMEWFWNKHTKSPDIHPVNHSQRGFASIAEDYGDRYGLPLMLTETNIRGTVQERLSWLKFMEQQCERVALSGHEFRGFCWYPSIDSTDWANACTRCTKIVDPQGIWTLDSSRSTRHGSELSRVYGSLARGEITSRDIPAHEFGSELKRRLRGYLPMMSDGNWGLGNALTDGLA